MVQSFLPGLAAAADVRVPPLAPLAVLAFLGAGFVLAVSGIGAAVALAARRQALARLLGGAALTVASGYGVALVVVSLLSRERTLAEGERKYFCEMDCHLAYSVVRTSREEGLRAVTVRTWFDPSTTSPYRGDGPLTPNPREVWLELRGGRRVPPSEGATRAWRERHGERSSLADALRPGESYDTTFVFDARDRGAARLFVGDAPGVEALLVGHENSPLHRRALFAVPEPGVPEPRRDGAARRPEEERAAVDDGRRS